jgi:AraC-like DNA-binding protein
MFILSISENIFLFISGLGFLQGFLLSILIYFHPKSDRSVNKFLAFYIACLSIVMSGPLLLQIISWKDGFFVGPFPVLVGPLLYFYIRSFKETITWRKALPHLILFFLYLLFSYWFVKYLANRYPDSKEFPEEGFRSPAALIFFAVRYIQLIIYYFMSKRELISYQKSILHLFSETSRINLHWVKWLINGYIIIIVSSIIIYFLMSKYPVNFYLLYLITIAIATPYIYMATYKGVTQPTIWQKVPEKEKENLEGQIQETEEIEKVSNKQQSQKPGLSDSRIKEIITKVLEAMDIEKLYQEPELTLQELSARLKFPSHQVSQAINEGMKKSFYDLVNGYRVDEARRLLLDSKNRNFTILSVGFEAGFNSKTTFNTVFKKFTGQTPTEYRDNQKELSVTT